VKQCFQSNWPIAPVFARKFAIFLVVTGLTVPHMTAWAQAGRDPTVSPLPAPLSANDLAAANASAANEPLRTGGFTIIVRDGQPRVMLGARTYAKGQSLGDYQIERISETEVWLRKGRDLKVVRAFHGVDRRTVPATTNK
jgi:hypothetical protein